MSWLHSFIAAGRAKWLTVTVLCAFRLQQLDSKLQSVSKYLANASMSVEAKQTLAEQTRQIHTEIEEIHHTIAEFGDTSGVIVR